MNLPNLPYKGNQIPNQPFSYPEVPATFDRLFGARVANEQLDPNPSDIVPSGGGGWVRPADWLPMPEVSETEEKFVGLFAVYDLPENLIALQFEGNYMVDWGDGTVENIASGEKAQHSYSWDGIPADTITTEGFRQVLVSVYPQDGQSLTQLDISVRHDNCPTGDTYVSTPWLDLLISLPQAESGGSIILTNRWDGGSESTWSFLADVKIVNIINSGGCTELGPLNFSFMSALNKLSIKSDFIEELLSDNFAYSYAIEEFTFDIPSLAYIEPQVFQSNPSLKRVSFSDMPLITSLAEVFYSNTSIEEVNLGNMPILEDASSLFEGCEQLKEVTIGSTPSLNIVDYMFWGCSSLTEPSLFDTSGVTSLYGVFGYCYCLETIPLFNTLNVIEMVETFYECYSLKQIPALNLTSLEYASYNFYYCSSLCEFPTISLSPSATDINFFFDRCSSLQSSGLSEVYSDIGYVGCLLNRDALINIFNNLGEVEGATINVSGNYGTDDLAPADIAIAEDKGWTVIY